MPLSSLSKTTPVSIWIYHVQLISFFSFRVWEHFRLLTGSILLPAWGCARCEDTSLLEKQLLEEWLRGNDSWRPLTVPYGGLPSPAVCCVLCAGCWGWADTNIMTLDKYSRVASSSRTLVCSHCPGQWGHTWVGIQLPELIPQHWCQLGLGQILVTTASNNHRLTYDHLLFSFI